MNFLFDQSADFRLMAHLRALGHDVTAISRNYPHGLADEDVLAIARDEQRILIVADRDFGELIFQHGLAHAGIIFFRLPGASLPTKVEQLNRVLDEHAEALQPGAFLVVSPGRIRIAGPPHPTCAFAFPLKRLPTNEMPSNSFFVLDSDFFMSRSAFILSFRLLTR